MHLDQWQECAQLKAGTDHRESNEKKKSSSARMALLDGALREVARKKIVHYRQLYINRPDPIAFLPAVVDTTGRLHDDFSRLLFLHVYREPSTLDNEIPEESDQFLFLRPTSYANIKESVGLILAKASAMRISIPLDLSSRSFIPLSSFIRSRHQSSTLNSFPRFYSSVHCLSGT